jgi:hypothetical protein
MYKGQVVLIGKLSWLSMCCSSTHYSMVQFGCAMRISIVVCSLGSLCVFSCSYLFCW